MLESPSIRWYSFTVTPSTEDGTMSSENPSGADNQQETATSGILRDCTPGTLEPTPFENVKIQSDPHGDMRSQAEMTWPRTRHPVAMRSNKHA